MRRKHWWGAAVGAGVLAVAVGAPAAYATVQHKPVLHPVPALSRTIRTTQHGRVVAKGRGDGHHDSGHSWGHCPYPPHGMPSVSISAQSRAHRSESVVVNGQMRVNGCGYDKFPAGLYRLDRGHSPSRWEEIASTTTGTDGGMSFTITAKRTATYVIVTAAGNGLGQGLSGPQVIEVIDHRGH